METYMSLLLLLFAVLNNWGQYGEEGEEEEEEDTYRTRSCGPGPGRTWTARWCCGGSIRSAPGPSPCSGRPDRPARRCPRGGPWLGQNWDHRQGAPRRPRTKRVKNKETVKHCGPSSERKQSFDVLLSLELNIWYFKGHTNKTLLTAFDGAKRKPDSWGRFVRKRNKRRWNTERGSEHSASSLFVFVYLVFNLCVFVTLSVFLFLLSSPRRPEPFCSFLRPYLCFVTSCSACLLLIGSLL